MLRSLLFSSIAGMRSMTPLAVATVAVRHGKTPPGRGILSLMGTRAIVAGMSALAVGEYAGDKMKSAPDRIVPLGIAARLITGAFAGAALAPKGQRVAAGILGGAVSTASAYLTFNLRMKALNRWGQTRSGLVEDAIALGSALLIAHGAGRPAWRRVA